MRTNYIIQDLLYGNYWSLQRQGFFGIALASQYNSLRAAKTEIKNNILRKQSNHITIIKQYTT